MYLLEKEMSADFQRYAIKKNLFFSLFQKWFQLIVLTHHFTRCALSFEQIGNHFRARHLIDSDFPYVPGLAKGIGWATMNTGESMNIITIFHNAVAYKFTAWKIKDLHVWSLGCTIWNFISCVQLKTGN